MHNGQHDVAEADTLSDVPNGDVVPATRLLLEAIARRVCIGAVYNRAAIKLAPHILYTKHGELFVDAVTVEREGKKPKEIKVGTFKLSGLSGLELTRRLFVPQTMFNKADGKYAGTTLLAVDS